MVRHRWARALCTAGLATSVVAVAPVSAATAEKIETHEAEGADGSVGAPPPAESTASEVALGIDLAEGQSLLRVELATAPIEYCLTWDPADLGLIPAVQALNEFAFDEPIDGVTEPESDWPTVLVLPLGSQSNPEPGPMVDLGRVPLNGVNGVVECADLIPSEGWIEDQRVESATPDDEAPDVELAEINALRIRWAPESPSDGYVIASGFVAPDSAATVLEMTSAGTAREAWLLESGADAEQGDVLLEFDENRTLGLRIAPPIEQTSLSDEAVTYPMSIVIALAAVEVQAPGPDANPIDPVTTDDVAEPSDPVLSDPVLSDPVLSDPVPVDPGLPDDEGSEGQELVEPAAPAESGDLAESEDPVVAAPVVAAPIVAEPEFTRLPDPVAEAAAASAAEGNEVPTAEPQPDDAAVAMTPAPPSASPVPLTAFTVLGANQSQDAPNPFASDAAKPQPESAIDVGGTEIIAGTAASPVQNPAPVAAHQAGVQAPTATPVAPEGNAGLAVDSAPAQLPHTGSGTQNLALSGLGMVLLGIALSRSGRGGHQSPTLVTR